MKKKYPLSVYSHITELPAIPVGYRKVRIGSTPKYGMLTVNTDGQWQIVNEFWGMACNMSKIKSHDYLTPIIIDQPPKSTWPTLEGRLATPLTSTKEAIQQLKNVGGSELSPLAQSILDGNNINKKTKKIIANKIKKYK